MVRSSRLFVSLLLGLTLAAGGWMAVRSGAVDIASNDPSGPTGESRVVLDEPPPITAKPLTLLEAWGVTEKQALAWQPDAHLVQLSSSDYASDDRERAGLDGRRRSWLAVASSSSTSSQLWITIVDATVTNAIEQPGSELERSLPQPMIDSPAAVAAALQALPDFDPGGGKGVGIHFALDFAVESTVPIIRVLGATGGRPAFVEIDGLSGTIVGSERQAYGGQGGVLYSRDGGQTWRASNLAGMVTSIAAHPLQEDSAFATVATGSGIVAYRTDDGGQTWLQSGMLPEQAGTWPYAIEAAAVGQELVLLVGTPVGLWVSRDEGVSWEHLSRAPSGPAWQVAARTIGLNTQIFVSIVRDPQDAAVYSSGDLVNWMKEDSGVFRLSKSADGAAVIAVDESRPGAAFVFGPQGRWVRALPGSSDDASPMARLGVVLRATGTFEPGSPLIAQSPDGIQISADGSNWRTTLEAPLASLAAATDFESSGVALAGGFGSGIYRSSDYGRTWSTVLSDPSSLVPGSGIVPAVVFLSPAGAVVVNGGELEWQPN